MAHDWQADFEQLVDEHQSMVFSLALRMTGDRGLAEEIAQDVFLELDRHLGKIESPLHALYWLRRVAMSRSADALRRRKVRGMDLWVEMEEGHGARMEDRETASALGLGVRLEQLLTTLPEPQRAALVLRYQEDLTPEEIAATLDAPLATVKSHLQRGLKLLRAKSIDHLKEFVRVKERARGI
jgi:RNA polymerase sigma-70 factor (ECF subfamily)